MLYGVDIHARYQAGINIATLRAEGYTFVVTKASEGTSIPSSSTLSASAFKARMLRWVEETRAQQMIPGLYHWIRSGNGAGQARFFYGLVREAGGPAGMLIQLDCEDDANYTDVQEWAAQWRQLSGGHPFLLYTGGWWWRPRGWNGLSVTPYLWDSHYLTADTDTIPDDPAAFAARIPSSWWAPGYGGWPAATILQFTSQGDAGTLGNNVDLNAFRGTLDQLRQLTGDNEMSEFSERDPWGPDPDGHNRTPAQKQRDDHAALYFGSRPLDLTGTPVGPEPWIVATGNKLLAAAAADETRDAAVLAAIEALAGSGTSIDTALIIQQIKAEAAATRDLVEQRHQAEMAAVAQVHAAQIAERDAELAGLRAELERRSASDTPT